MWGRMVLDARRSVDEPDDEPADAGPDERADAGPGDRAEESVESSGTVSA